MPSGEETSHGAGASSFPDTTWFERMRAGDPQAIDRFAAAYWRPVYRMIRRKWGKDVETAKDLTQGFFVSILEDRLLDGYDPAKGRFRHYLKGALRNFVADEERARRRLKRGGGQAVMNVDFVELASADEAPDESFDREWARTLLDAAVADARARRPDDFPIYERYTDAARTYAELAKEFGRTEAEVMHALSRVRAEIRASLSHAIGTYAGSADDVRAELRELFDL